MIHGSLSLKMRSYSLFLVVRQPSFLAILDAAIDKAVEGVMTPADKVLPRTELEVGLFVFIVVLCQQLCHVGKSNWKVRQMSSWS